MAKNITLMGAEYQDVPAVQLPQTGGGTATFYDTEPIQVEYTLKNGFTLESWGSINIYVVGNLLVINCGGIKSTNAVSTDTEFMNVKNFSFTRAGNAYSPVWRSDNGLGIVMCYTNNAFHVARLPTANTVFDFNMIIPLSNYTFS